MKKNIPFEYKVTVSYILIGSLWILFSDKLVVAFTTDIQQVRLLSTYKGWFYVLVTGFLLFVFVRNEIQRRNRIETKLLEANKKAMESDNLKTTFLLNLNHYIRTPMNTILGFVDLLKTKDLHPDKRELFLKFIHQRSQQLLQILQSILEMAKLQEGQVVIIKTDFSVDEMLTVIIDLMNLEISNCAKPIKVIVSIPVDNKPDYISSDKEKISLILSHLANNAVKYTLQGEINIGYKIEGGSLIFFVIDTGTGISPEKQKNLISQFMHTPDNIYTEGEGAGIGLYLSAKFAQLLGGKLWLEATNKNGTEFRLQLPIK